MQPILPQTSQTWVRLHSTWLGALPSLVDAAQRVSALYPRTSPEHLSELL